MSFPIEGVQMTRLRRIAGLSQARQRHMAASQMIRLLTNLARTMVVSLSIGCAAAPASPTSNTASLGVYASAHFTLHYPAMDAATIADTADRMEQEYARVTAALGVAAMPRVHVTFYTNHSALEAATIAAAGIVPSWTYGLVTAEDQIHVMSPNLPEWAPYERRMADLTHEFAHGVTLHINRRFANNPRWLWESIAIYEANQFVSPRTLPYMTSLQPPSFAQLSNIADTRIYDVGYTIAEFIVSRWGADALPALVQRNGDTQSVLGTAIADVERDWLAFVRLRYQF